MAMLLRFAALPGLARLVLLRRCTAAVLMGTLGTFAHVAMPGMTAQAQAPTTAADAAAPTPAKLREMARTPLLFQACIRRLSGSDGRYRTLYQRWRAENQAWFAQHEQSDAYQSALEAAREYAREFYYTSEDASGTFASLCQGLLSAGQP